MFLKARHPMTLTARYADHFGIARGEDPTSVVFDGAESMGMTVFAHFPDDTKYFGDGPQRSMINLRVDDLDALPAQLTAAGVRIDRKREDYPYGRFAWIWDPEGNRVELCQPLSAG